MHRIVDVKDDHYVCLGDNTYSYEYIKPSANMFFAMAGIYLCMVALADERSLADMLMLIGCIIYHISVIAAQSKYISRTREALNREMYP